MTAIVYQLHMFSEFDEHWKLVIRRIDFARHIFHHIDLMQKSIAFSNEWYRTNWYTYCWNNPRITGSWIKQTRFRHFGRKQCDATCQIRPYLRFCWPETAWKQHRANILSYAIGKQRHIIHPWISRKQIFICTMYCVVCVLCTSFPCRECAGKKW